MRIANRKRFTLSCIFFTLVMSIFGKADALSDKENALKSYSVPVAKVFGKENRSGDTKNVLRENSKYIVVLDAGHGGVDMGTSYGAVNEKDLTLKIVKYAEEYLKNKGYTIILTRNKDVLVPLKEIGNKANESKANVFVSVHINSLKDPNYGGISTYFYDPEGYEKEERMKLARIIQNQVLKSDKWEDRGIRRQNFAVLRYSKMPSVLVECGYITNKEDRDKLSKEETLKSIGESISKGIIEYVSNKDNDNYKYSSRHIDEVNNKANHK